jgi:hypothetical protein
VEGNVLTGQYMISDVWYVGSTYFFDQKLGMDLGKDQSYSRLQIDTGLKY